VRVDEISLFQAPISCYVDFPLQAPDSVCLWFGNRMYQSECVAWQIVHGRLPANKMISRWGSADPYCYHCAGRKESIIHVLCNCPLASFVWIHLLPLGQRRLFFVGDIKDCVNFNMSNKLKISDVVSWPSVWATACYS